MIDIGEVITAMVTPFDKKYNLDIDSCGKLLDYLINEGSDGVLLSGSTGESSTLNDDEKIKLFKFVKDNFGDRIKIIA
ncbi:MAG: dihydrodipicolinate synthase family protein, partial [Candidatus Hydromicrobium sp.]